MYNVILSGSHLNQPFCSVYVKVAFSVFTSSPYHKLGFFSSSCFHGGMEFENNLKWFFEAVPSWLLAGQAKNKIPTEEFFIVATLDQP